MTMIMARLHGWDLSDLVWNSGSTSRRLNSASSFVCPLFDVLLAAWRQRADVSRHATAVEELALVRCWHVVDNFDGACKIAAEDGLAAHFTPCRTRPIGSLSIWP